MRVDFKSTIGDICQSINGEIKHGSPQTKVSAINSDSRKSEIGDLFVPIVGEKFDGHDFIKDLVSKKKIAGFITTRESDLKLAEEYNVDMILCEDTLFALGSIASVYREKFNLICIGITGTNGKTTTKELLATLVDEKYICLKNEKNYNNEIGVPFALMNLNSSHQRAVVEMGMNHAGEISRLSKIVKPDISLITNIGEGHLEFLGSVENVARAKAEIIDGMQPGSTLFLNKDSEYIDLIIEYAELRKINVKTFGASKNADIYPEKYTLFADRIEILYKGTILTVPLYGIHNLYNIMGAIVCAEEAGLSVAEIKTAFSKFKNVEKRSQVTHNEYTVINDTYNSNPASLRCGLQSVGEIYADCNKIAVLSDMKELGEQSEYYHKKSGNEVFNNNFSLLYTWGEMSSWISEGALEAGMDSDVVRHFENKEELIKSLQKHLKKNDVVFIKGSRSMKMEEVADALIR